jgi:hypothetical protein
MSPRRAIRDIIETLEEQERLYEVLLAGSRCLSEDLFKELSAIVCAHDRMQILLDTMLRNDAALVTGNVAASRRLN